MSHEWEHHVVLGPTNGAMGKNDLCQSLTEAIVNAKDDILLVDALSNHHPVDNQFDPVESCDLPTEGDTHA